LKIAAETSRWLCDRFERDGVPAGTLRTARLMLSLREDEGGRLVVEYATELETESKIYQGRDTTRWHPGD